MRKHKTVELDPGRRVVVRELRVGEVEHIRSILTPEELKRPWPEMFHDHFPEIMTIIDESLQFPDGETFKDLSLSECEAIGHAWWEMHRRFVVRLVEILLAGRTLTQNETAAPSSAPA